MSKATAGRTSGREMAGDRQFADGTGIAAGTIILTLDGALPVEFIEPGDRIITREGMRVPRVGALRRSSRAAPPVTAGVRGRDRPGHELTLPRAVPRLLRGATCPPLLRASWAVVPIERIADGEFIVKTTALSMRLYDLRFDTPQVIYAEGLELACGSTDITEDVKLAAE